MNSLTVNADEFGCTLSSPYLAPLENSVEYDFLDVIMHKHLFGKR